MFSPLTLGTQSNKFVKRTLKMPKQNLIKKMVLEEFFCFGTLTLILENVFLSTVITVDKGQWQRNLYITIFLTQNITQNFPSELFGRK